MSKCIYTGVDESTGTFESEEHIFPKCIGGVHTLPKGWVCDSVNNSLSGVERCFARDNPTVALSRMFFRKMGRKKHKNRNLIGVFKNTNNPEDFALGYISDGVPYSINQVCITADIPIAEGSVVPLKVIVPPSDTKDHTTQITELWEQLCLFDGKTCVIKDETIPLNMLLLGYQDTRWYLGMSKNQNEEQASASVNALIRKMITTQTVDDLIKMGTVGRDKHQVQARFSMQTNLYEVLRAYAKIAVNCLARLKGHEYVMNESFNDIKSAILTGENIQEHVCIPEGSNTLKTILSKFEQLNLGEKYHSATFFCKDGILYSEVALYGFDNVYLVKLGTAPEFSMVDAYICDWENKAEYTLLDCVLKICDHDERLP